MLAFAEHLQKIPFLLSLFLPIILFFLLGLWIAHWCKRKNIEAAKNALAEQESLLKELNSVHKDHDSSDQALRAKLDSWKSRAIACEDAPAPSIPEPEPIPVISTPDPVVEEEPPAPEPEAPQINSLAGSYGDADVSVDEELGLVYKSRPDEVDDLKLIKGVATVLEGKLNDFGVYRFKQIANWSDEVIDEFCARLSFADRVRRDNWLPQARQFHKEKYGEDA